MRFRVIGFLLLTSAAITILAAGPTTRPGRETRWWWQKVRADLEKFKRPIYDRRARSKPGDKPLVNKGRYFCPHEDRSPLKARVLWQSPPDVSDAMAATAYYCEIEGIYWVHLVGGIQGLNLVTGPYRLGVGPPETRPATRPASRPAGDVLRLHLERVDSPPPPAAGTPLVLALRFINAGHRPIWVNINLALASLRLEIRGPRVQTEPVSSPVPPRPPRRSDFVRIDPKDSHRIVIRNLTAGHHRYRLALPGAYLIRAVYRNDHDGASLGLHAWTGTVASDPLVVQTMGQSR